MSERLQGSDGLTLSVGDFHAKTLAMQVIESGLTESALVYGERCGESFATYDPDSSSWKTSQLCLDGGLSEFSETWPRSGMTRSGIVCPLAPTVPLTDVTGFSSFPTPAAFDAHDVTEFRKDSNILDGGKHSVSLTHYVQAWPTPQSRDFNAGSKLGSKRMQRKLREGWSPNLNDVVLWTSPENNGQLNPTWVEWLMGYPLGWTDLRDSETPSSPKSRSGSAEEL